VQIPSVAPHLLELIGPRLSELRSFAGRLEEGSSGLAETLQDLCDVAGTNIRTEGRRFHDEAIATLRKGPKTWVHVPTSEERAAWEQLARDLEPRVRGELVPASIYDEVKAC
jgi:hypothetical protein